MALQILLDDVDITADLNHQYALPTSLGGIFPDASGQKWWDLLRCINKHPELKNNFFKGGVHIMKVIDQNGSDFKVKLLLRMTYSARNS